MYYMKPMTDARSRASQSKSFSVRTHIKRIGLGVLRTWALVFCLACPGLSYAQGGDHALVLGRVGSIAAGFVQGVERLVQIMRHLVSLVGQPAERLGTLVAHVHVMAGGHVRGECGVSQTRSGVNRLQK